MATDRREQILVRLHELAGQVDGVTEALRNSFNLPDEPGRRVVIMDGDEQADDGDPARRPPTAPRRVTMTPEIYLIDVDLPEEIGADINAFRRLFLGKVLHDDTLRDLTMDGEGLAYEGCVSGLSLAQRGIEAALAINLAARYVFRPSDLL